LLTEYCHISWTEAWLIPIEYRKWLINRKQEENKRIKEANEKAKKAKPGKH
jgi:hypothetical protein